MLIYNSWIKTILKEELYFIMPIDCGSKAYTTTYPAYELHIS